MKSNEKTWGYWGRGGCVIDFDYIKVWGDCGTGRLPITIWSKNLNVLLLQTQHAGVTNLNV